MWLKLAVLAAFCVIAGAGGSYGAPPAAAPPVPRPRPVPVQPGPPPPAAPNGCCVAAAAKVAHLENKVDELDDDRKELQRSYNRLNDLVIVLNKRQYNDYKRLRALLDKVNKTLVDNADDYRGSVGPAGPAGPDGPPGNDGEPGDFGVDGIDGEDKFGENGEDGMNGAVGDQGPQGPEGPKGLSSSIEGPKGASPQGPAGPAGGDGPQGPIGPVGPTGLCGQPGLPGADIVCTQEEFAACSPPGDDSPAPPSAPHRPPHGRPLRKSHPHKPHGFPPHHTVDAEQDVSELDEALPPVEGEPEPDAPHDESETKGDNDEFWSFF